MNQGKGRGRNHSFGGGREATQSPQMYRGRGRGRDHSFRGANQKDANSHPLNNSKHMRKKIHHYNLIFITKSKTIRTQYPTRKP